VFLPGSKAHSGERQSRCKTIENIRVPNDRFVGNLFEIVASVARRAKRPTGAGGAG
jgi:hypothetical protein